jgi:hypothetical protein
MTIDKAIEILSDSAARGVTTHGQDFRDALLMGVVALIRVKNNRVSREVYQRGTLPGETE